MPNKYKEKQKPDDKFENYYEDDGVIDCIEKKEYDPLARKNPKKRSINSNLTPKINPFLA